MHIGCRLAHFRPVARCGAEPRTLQMLAAESRAIGVQMGKSAENGELNDQ
jgi:hypothetical protein